MAAKGVEFETAPCAKCKAPTDTLASFPGGICLECYRPQGERIAHTMTADKLTAMWGGKPAKERSRNHGR